jgi:7,8-dihydropterin-6-yl-methyl-4-(beta-D-ribofuranosyl)aminobenzene 5'-phosphate synthase
MSILLPVLLSPLLGTGLGAGLAAPQQPPLPRIDRLTERVHRIVVDGKFPANVLVLQGEDGCLLVDTGFENTRGDLDRALARLRAKPVHTIINTHPHPDHSSGNAILQRDGVVFAHAAASDFLDRYPNCVPIDEPTTIEVAGDTIHLLPFPLGHSGADLAIHFERAKVLCLGDLYLSESFPAVDLEAGSVASLLENLERVLEIFPSDVQVVPGHGRVTTMAELAIYVDRMKDTVAIVRRELATGKGVPRILRERPLQDYHAWGTFFSFIDEDRWIQRIADSYADQPFPAEQDMPTPSTTAGQEKLPSPRFTILFNNMIGAPHGLEIEWGFSCLIEGFAEPLLFDTGQNGDMLLANMRKLGVEPGRIKHVLFSHQHGDHTGGFKALAAVQPNTHIYPLAAFPDDLNASLAAGAAETTLITTAREIFPGVHTTGAMGRRIPEQALLLDTAKGLVVLTGCAHPGILEIVRRARQTFHRDIYLVIGGFHLPGHSDEEIRAIIAEFQELGVARIAPTHCTGERGLELFREAWGDNYIDAGCGNQIVL